mgnify:CR=1 FL=1
MYKRIVNPSKSRSFFLFGARGTGKSTWVGALLPDALRVDLLHESTFVELLGHADRLEAMADAARARVIVLDEVQKLPALLDGCELVFHCAGCHQLIDPIGFGFEEFDVVLAVVKPAAPRQAAPSRELSGVSGEGGA